MKPIQFNPVTSETADLFLSLMRDYAKELDEHQNRSTNPATLEKWTDSIIAKSKNDKSRILKLCYADDEAIGFLVAKIDQPNDKGYIRVGCGYIMEFYVIPGQRRKGYGKAMLRHIEQFFREQGVIQMYLTADPVTGKPFWSALGFTSKGEFSPDNGQEIFERVILSDIVTISTSEFLTKKLAEKIALAQWNNSDLASGIIRILYDCKTETDCFNVVAENSDGAVVGRLFCIQNDIAPRLWYYGDLFVIPECRRRHIAQRMLETAIEAIKDRGGTVLRCYVEPDNYVSLSLQEKFAFERKSYQTFMELINDGRLMFEKDIVPYHAEKADTSAAVYITRLYGKNVDTLHGNEISYNEWCEALSANDEDEAHFLIYKGAIPVAWLKINGLCDNNSSWISMLAVEPKYHRQGVGTFAVDFTEQYCKSEGKKQLFVKTTEDNIAAQKLYIKCGFAVCDKITYATGDGISRTGTVFSKIIE